MWGGEEGKKRRREGEGTEEKGRRKRKGTKEGERERKMEGGRILKIVSYETPQSFKNII